MTAAAFGLFLLLLAVCLAAGWNVAWALSGGLVLFFCLGLRKGFAPGQLWDMAWKKGRKSLIVVGILLLIGALTGMWRAGGTIPFCIVCGIRLITPWAFLLVALLLTAALSYALGTAFGVTSTAGVVLMALARAGGVNELLAAGAILSGVYFGDRCSPASSSASLVAAVTGTKLYQNVKGMFRTGVIPVALTVVVYTVLSFANPIASVDPVLLEAMTEAFDLAWPVILPAAAMVLLPLLQIPIQWAMGISIGMAALCAAVYQGCGLEALIRSAVLGYVPADPVLAGVLSGGGIVSMASACVIVMVTSLYSGILEGIGALDGMRSKILSASARFGRFPAMLGTSLVCLMIFCNQSVGILLSEQLMGGAYQNREELAMDIENTSITMAALVPWSIACSIPLTMLGVGLEALPFGVFLWALPLCYLVTKQFYYPGDPIAVRKPAERNRRKG